MNQDLIQSLPTFHWDRATYDAHKALNQSGLKHLLVTPGHYQHHLNNPSKETEALRVGRLTHMAVLEPAMFDLNVVCAPEDAPKRPTEKQRNAKKPKPETLEAIQFWQNFDEQTKGKIVADKDEYSHAWAMACALNKELRHWGIGMDEGDKIKMIGRELSLVADYGSVPIKAQLDFIGSDGFIYDLKTIRDTLSPSNVLRNVYAMGYHIQAAFYMMICKQVMGERPKGFRLVFVEKDAPHATAIFELSPEIIAQGGVLVANGIEAYKSATEFNHWPFYPKTINILQPRNASAPDNPISFA